VRLLPPSFFSPNSLPFLRSYFEHLQPWTCLLSSTLDRHPLVVRERSPLLFHAILLLALYYRPRSPGNVILYRAVSSILDSILAPQILCPQPDQLSLDLVRALDLLVMYKPLQWAALNARGVSDPAQIESSSKMNVRASWIIRLLVSRVSQFTGLPNVATTSVLLFSPSVCRTDASLPSTASPKPSPINKSPPSLTPSSPKPVSSSAASSTSLTAPSRAEKPPTSALKMPAE
jgi:hypothetical protein